MLRRIAILAIALVAAAGCSKATTTTAAGGAAAPGTAPSAVKASPETAASGSPGAASSAQSHGPAGGTRYYNCAKLLTVRETQQATGLSNASFFHEDKSGPYKGQTYCQFFGGKSDSIAVSVWTGPAYHKVFLPLMAAGQSLPNIPGIGDEAKWTDKGTALGARAGSTGVTIVFKNTGGGSLGMADPKGAALAMVRLILPRL